MTAAWVSVWAALAAPAMPYDPVRWRTTSRIAIVIIAIGNAPDETAHGEAERAGSPKHIRYGLATCVMLPGDRGLHGRRLAAQ